MFEESLFPKTIFVLCIRRRYSRVRIVLICIRGFGRLFALFSLLFSWFHFRVVFFPSGSEVYFLVLLVQCFNQMIACPHVIVWISNWTSGHSVGSSQECLRQLVKHMSSLDSTTGLAATAGVLLGNVNVAGRSSRRSALRRTSPMAVGCPLNSGLRLRYI